ncbi:hypothetical protein [Fulvivirga lutea]|uniref:Lipoprotein n=1 Tax=Fulvivirga lutea TaxID=2810512 RepID=A0A974WF51_9BACT|nr:hypothetical protein [Fulvivirga lutea]QSE97303.1 hypothetical protein JR347_17225 [Fulvivirga lutea]
MKGIIAEILVVALMLVLFASCGPRPQYKTAKGKKKLKYYNSVQYDRVDVADYKKIRN